MTQAEKIEALRKAARHIGTAQIILNNAYSEKSLRPNHYQSEMNRYASELKHAQAFINSAF